MTPPESPTDRLNRELWRYRLREGQTWLAAAVGLAVVAVVLVLTAGAIPREVRHLPGRMVAATPLMTESGIHLDLRVEVGGVLRPATSRAQLVHPAPGERICLRETRSWLGQRTLHLVDERQCSGEVGADR